MRKLCRHTKMNYEKQGDIITVSRGSLEKQGQQDVKQWKRTRKIKLKKNRINREITYVYMHCWLMYDDQ